ncbi:hypothetical protein IB75_17010, partial [Nitrosococcus oceani C-27]
KHDTTPKFRMALFAALGAGTSIGIVLALTNLVPLTLVVVIAISPLFIPGFIAKRMETELREHDEWYPPFIRHFGEIYTMVGSMGQALDAVL